MIRSMTGYGRAEGRANGVALTVELRSVNHRYCDIVVKLPRQFVSLEETIKKKIKQWVTRGHLELFVNINGSSEIRYNLDLASAQGYYHVLKKLKDALHLPGEVQLSHLVQFKDLITPIEPAGFTETAGSLLKKVLENAIRSFDKARCREGGALSKEMASRIHRLSKMLAEIERQRKRGLPIRYQRLQKRVEELTKGVTVDPERLAQEVAILADRNDISEEVSRLKVHFSEFQRLLRDNTAVGRTLDFLAQEIGREINTIGSKANDEKIALQVVAMKSEMEKVREQVQNIE